MKFVAAFVSLALAALAAPALGAAPSAPAYGVVERIAGPDGGWDIAQFDPVKRRVYVGRSDGVMVLDLGSGAISRLAPAARAHEVLPLLRGAVVLQTDAGTNTARLIDTGTGAVLASIPTGEDPDAEAFDPVSGMAYVMNAASGTATVIDPAARRAVATVEIGGKLEFAAADGKGRMFVNVEDRADIAVIDTAKRRVVARYKLPDCVEPSGLAYVPEGGLLISSCSNRVAIALRASTGRVVARLPIGLGPDTVAYDAARRLVFIPCGRDGVMAVISVPGVKPRLLATIPTQKGARTAALDPRTGRLYLPTAEYLPATAPGERPKMKPGTFQILVVAPRGSHFDGLRPR